MLYQEEVVDRRTGELVTVSRGDWITLNELAELHRVGRRHVRTILRKMGFLHITGTGDHERHRIVPWAVVAGLGRTNRAKSGARHPFDVISPEGRAWIGERWSETVAALQAETTRPEVDAREALEAFQASRGRHAMTTQECVSWLCHFVPGLSHEQMGRVLDVSQPLVSRYVKVAEDQRRRAIERRDAELPDLGRMRMRGLLGDQAYEHHQG